ncbi:DUF3459 domain-containing protein, partial [Streptomyces albidoflavus]
EAQTGDPTSTLELYRAALAVRREHPGLGAGQEITWREAPEGVLAFARPAFACTANTTGAPVRLPAPGRPLLASQGAAPAVAEDGTVELPADTTVWWTV